MSTIRKFIALVMLLALFLILFTVASANTTMNTEMTTITPNINPYEYGTSPEHMYVFIYHGYSPYFSVDIDTSICTEDRLYIYDAVLNAVTEISNQQVAYYTCTKDALFFVTSTQEVYKTDYTGQSVEFLYQSAQGCISDFANYLDTLYFIEDGSRIIILNYNTGAAQTAWNCADLAWSFQLSPTELVVATMNEEYYLLDITTGTAPAIGTMTASGLITAAVTSEGTASEVNESGMSLMAYFSPSSIQSKNDISLPLPEYPVTLGDSYTYHQYNYTRPTTWFHHNKAEGCHLNGYESNCVEYTDTSECEGFARYAHDKYLHNVAPDGTDYDVWSRTYPRYGRREFDDIDSVKSFFVNLDTGDYVRYGQDGDSTPSNGVHSIVFVSRDEKGIWAYECNQNYTGLKDGETLNGQPKSYYGCGIHLQYYSFEEICKRYQYVVYYIKHDYTEDTDFDYYNTTYHNVGCSHCVGFVRRTHSNISATIASATQHNATFNCCGGNTATALHTGTTLKSYYSSAKHKVTATCCSGNVLENHTYKLGGTICTGCGLGNNNIMSIEDYTTENI